MSLPKAIIGKIDTITCSTACSFDSTDLLPSASPVAALTPCLSAPPLEQSGFRRVTGTEESPCPIPGLDRGVLEMRVKEGSKIRNLLGFAAARMQADGVDVGRVRGSRQVVFTGSGRGLTKTVTCAEILKRKLGGLHQLSKLYYKVMSEVREGVESGGPRVTVHRTVPAIGILLSKDPLDPAEPGYQPPQPLAALSEDREEALAPLAGQRTLHTSCSQHKQPPDAKRACREDRLHQAPL